MICSICGCEYHGTVCPICHANDAVKAEVNDFSRFDYFPRRAQIRAMEIPGNPTPNSWEATDRNVGYSQAVSEDNTAFSQVADGSAFQANEYGFCPKCGNELKGAFCSRCGYRFGAENDAGWHTAGDCNPAYQNQAQPKTKGWVIGLIIAVGVLRFIVLPIILLIIFVMLTPNVTREYNDSIRDNPFFNYNYDDDLNPDDYDSFEDYLDDYLRRRGFSSDLPEDQEDQDPDDEIPEDEGTSLLPNGVSIAEYKQLEVGMSYSQISAIIGGDGTVVEQGENSFTAVWPGEYLPQAVVFITFEDGVATTIEQNGLFETNN